ncbi:nucleocapsid [Sefomo virus]|nr:nucleocapsid [Sefomo virus]
MSNMNQDDIQEAESYLNQVKSSAFKNEDLKFSVDKLEYQGFNPIIFLAHLVSVAKEKKISPADHAKNLKTLAVLGTMRGGKVKRIADKSLSDTKSWIEKMMGLYSITPNKPISSLDVTLLRIAACHAAPIALSIAAGLPIKTTISAISIHQDFPPYMCISTFGSLIPVDIKQDDVVLILGAFLYHQQLFDRVINPRAPSSKETLRSYVDIQYTSNLYNAETRTIICTQLGLLVKSTNGYVINSGIRAALAHAAGKFKE